MALRDALGLALVVLIWGTNFVVIKIGVGHFPPLFMTGLRFAAVAALLAWAYRPPRERLGEIAVLSTVFGVGHFGLLFIGTSGVDAAVASVMYQLGVPLSVPLAWLLLGERMGWRAVLGLALAFAGVVVLAGEPRTISSPLHFVILLGAALGWALGTVRIRRMRSVDALALNAWIGLLAAPQLFLLSAVLESGQRAAVVGAPWWAWAALGHIVVVSTVVAYGLWYGLLKRHEVTRIAPATLLSPVIGVVAGVALLAEPFTWEKAVGAACIILGVAVIQIRRTGEPRAAGPA